MAIASYEIVDTELQTTSGENNTSVLTGLNSVLTTQNLSEVTYDVSLEAKAAEIANEIYNIRQEAANSGLTSAQEKAKVTDYYNSLLPDTKIGLMYSDTYTEFSDEAIQNYLSKIIVSYYNTRGIEIENFCYITTQIGEYMHLIAVFE